MNKVYIMKIINGVHILRIYVFSEEENAIKACKNVNEDFERMDIEGVVAEVEEYPIEDTGE